MLCKKTKGTIARVYASYNEVSCALERGHVQKQGQGTQACNVCAFTHWNSWYVYILKNNYCTWNLDLAEAESYGRSDGKNMRLEEKYISVLSCHNSFVWTQVSRRNTNVLWENARELKYHFCSQRNFAFAYKTYVRSQNLHIFQKNFELTHRWLKSFAS